jgi:sterol 3beta-glucosyltransferase
VAAPPRGHTEEALKRVVILTHGGRGTTGAALAADRPQVVRPFLADQAF